MSSRFTRPLCSQPSAEGRRHRLPSGILLSTCLLLFNCSEHQDEVPPVDVPTSSRSDTNTKPPGRLGTLPNEFVDLTRAAGVETPPAHSVAFVDFDDDGWPDLTVGTAVGVYLFRNQGDGTFANETLRLRIPAQDRGAVHTTVYADIDDDGDLDLYMGRRAHADQLLLNDGKGRFDPVTTAGLPPSIGVRGVVFGDTDGDGDLDLFVCIGQDPTLGVSDSAEGAGPDHYLTNEGGTFQATESPVSGPQKGVSYTALLVDLDRDHDLDLFVGTANANDRYYQNENGQFVEKTESMALNRLTSLMGMSVADYNGDGLLDIFATDAFPDALYQAQPSGGFEQVYPLVLTEGVDRSSAQTGWGCTFLDADNDGDEDVLTISSFDDQFDEPGGVARIGGFMFLENNGLGGFADRTEDAGTLLTQDINGSGLARADYDRDGDIDVAIALAGRDEQFEENPDDLLGLRLLRNDGTRAAGQRSLRIELKQPAPNHWAVGAIIDVETPSSRTSAVVTAGESYLSAHDFTQHFGLGSATRATVRVQWPGGQQDEVELESGAWRLSRNANTVEVATINDAAPAASLELPCDSDCEQCQALCETEACQQMRLLERTTLNACVVDCWLTVSDPEFELCER